MDVKTHSTLRYFHGVILVSSVMLLLSGCNIWEFNHMVVQEKSSLNIPGISLKTGTQNEMREDVQSADEVNIGDRVALRYTIYLEQGAELQPVKLERTTEFTVGRQEVFSEIEKAILGMQTNGTKRIVVPADDAYGPRYDELVHTLPRSFLPETMNPQPGQTIELRDQNGDIIACKIIEVNAENVRIDLNHPLAGKDLVFEVRVLQITSG
ncbi:MAG TPA: FKBP-type peptidyl-prolyl cis-trans isomerase [bacterium]|nr:FKBP-type peptidyl-prolyl cis-trans isomerase [bacterium]